MRVCKADCSVRTISVNAPKISSALATMITVPWRCDSLKSASPSARTGSVAALIPRAMGLSNELPPNSGNRSARAEATFARTPVAISTGNKIRTAR